jgi:hypothetical protein
MPTRARVPRRWPACWRVTGSTGGLPAVRATTRLRKAYFGDRADVLPARPLYDGARDHPRRGEGSQLMRKAPVVHVAIAALLLLAAGVAFGGQDTAGNQQGPGINDRLANLDALCRLNGGTPGASSTDTVKTRHYCLGGYLDGLYCDVYADLTYCYWEGVGRGPSAAGPWEVVTNVDDLTFVTDLAADAVAPLTVELASQPLLVDAVITWNPPADGTDAARMVQVNACRHLGGQERVARATGDANADIAVVGCAGGLLDGFWCALGTGPRLCYFAPGAGQDAQHAMPTDPATSVPTATARATEGIGTEAPTGAPTESLPTPPMAPTDSPPTHTAAPTDAPVIEPTLGDPGTGNPWDLPEGTLQVLEPAPPPTEAPLR